MAYSLPVLVAAGTVVFTLILLTVSLYSIRKSVPRTLLDLFALPLISLAWAISILAGVIRYTGMVFRFTALYQLLFDFYPGSGFAHDRREEFIERGISHIDRGIVEVERTPDELTTEIRALYNDSGRQLSDGEAFFGFSLAVVGYFSLGPEPTTTALSLGLALAAATRVTALDTIMFADPDSDEDPKRLRMMLAWNQAMSNGAKIVSALAIFRFIRSVDVRLYEFYLDHTFDRTLEGDSLSKKEVPSTFLFPFVAIIKAKMDGVDPSVASHELYGMDVLERPPTGEDTE